MNPTRVTTAVLSLIAAVFSVLTEFGFNLTAGQQAAILKLAGIALPLIVGELAQLSRKGKHAAP